MFSHRRIYVAYTWDNLKQSVLPPGESALHRTLVFRHTYGGAADRPLSLNQLSTENHMRADVVKRTQARSHSISRPQLSCYFPTLHSWNSGIRVSDQLSPATWYTWIPCWGIILNNGEHHLAQQLCTNLPWQIYQIEALLSDCWCNRRRKSTVQLLVKELVNIIATGW